MKRSTVPLALRRLPGHVRSLAVASSAAFALLVGQIVDESTGQPLTRVDIHAEGGGKTADALTNDSGKYTLRGLIAGHYTLTLSSDDVPPQTFEVDVRTTKSQRFNMIACSTTLDYSCASVLR